MRRRTLPLMLRNGVTEVLVVTHGWHMPRAVRAFEQAANGRLKVTAAPMGLAPRIDRPLLKWLANVRRPHARAADAARMPSGCWPAVSDTAL